VISPFGVTEVPLTSTGVELPSFGSFDAPIAGLTLELESPPNGTEAARLFPEPFGEGCGVIELADPPIAPVIGDSSLGDILEGSTVPLIIAVPLEPPADAPSLLDISSLFVESALEAE
jgi:hypothetical protein